MYLLLQSTNTGDHKYENKRPFTAHHIKHAFCSATLLTFTFTSYAHVDDDEYNDYHQG